MHYLRYLSRQGAPFLHPGSEKLTGFLLQSMNLAAGMTVLEIGCGTGATLVELASRFDVELTGADTSAYMLRTAKQRLLCCGLKHKVALCLLKANGELPFPDGYFSVVYAESVLAICNSEILPVLLKEIARVLKPGGLLLSNDAIWKPGTSIECITQINQQCMIDFNIIQSLGLPADVNDWQRSFEQAGLLVMAATLVTPDLLDRIPAPSLHKRSALFTRLKKLSARIQPAHLYRIRTYKQLLASHSQDGAQLENYLFILQKPEA